MTQIKYNHVSTAAQVECDADNHIRIKSILTDKFIAYSRASELQNHVEYLFSQPPQSRASGLVIMGEPGSGKTKIAQSIVRRSIAINREGNRHDVQVVMINMTGARDARTLFNRILEVLGTPNSSSMRLSDREQLVLHLLHKANTRLLIVDEIQDVLSSTLRQQRAALDTIKLIMNELAMPILCLGVKEAAQAMQSDPHLNARFDYRGLPNWTVGQELRALVTAYERTLPLRMPSNLDSLRMMKLIVRKSRGNLAKIIRLINYAAVFGILSGKERIDAELIDEAEVRVPPAHALISPAEGITGTPEDKDEQ